MSSPESLAELTPLVKRITADADRWCWQLTSISVFGVHIEPSFTEQMHFVEGRRITFEHPPPPGHRSGPGDWAYTLEDSATGGTHLSVDITLHVELPLPALLRQTVERVMASMMARTGRRSPGTSTPGSVSTAHQARSRLRWAGDGRAGASARTALPPFRTARDARGWAPAPPGATGPPPPASPVKTAVIRRTQTGCRHYRRGPAVGVSIGGEAIVLDPARPSTFAAEPFATALAGGAVLRLGLGRLGPNSSVMPRRGLPFPARFCRPDGYSSSPGSGMSYSSTATSY